MSRVRKRKRATTHCVCADGRSGGKQQLENSNLNSKLSVLTWLLSFCRPAATVWPIKCWTASRVSLSKWQVDSLETGLSRNSKSWGLQTVHTMLHYWLFLCLVIRCTKQILKTRLEMLATTAGLFYRTVRETCWSHLSPIGCPSNSSARTCIAWLLGHCRRPCF